MFYFFGEDDVHRKELMIPYVSLAVKRASILETSSEFVMKKVVQVTVWERWWKMNRCSLSCFSSVVVIAPQRSYT